MFKLQEAQYLLKANYVLCLISPSFSTYLSKHMSMVKIILKSLNNLKLIMIMRITIEKMIILFNSVNHIAIKISVKFMARSYFFRNGAALNQSHTNLHDSVEEAGVPEVGYAFDGDQGAVGGRTLAFGRVSII